MSPKTNLKKTMRQAIRQYMFSNSELIFSSSNREALIVSTFVFYIFCTNFSVLLNYAICNSSKVVSAREWMQAVMGSDDILRISNIYDDLRHKFTSNVKCEFVVCALCLTICDVYVHSLN